MSEQNSGWVYLPLVFGMAAGVTYILHLASPTKVYLFMGIDIGVGGAAAFAFTVFAGFFGMLLYPLYSWFKEREK